MVLGGGMAELDVLVEASSYQVSPQRTTSLSSARTGQVSRTGRTSLRDPYMDMRDAGRPISEISASERSIIDTAHLIIQAMASCGADRAAMDGATGYRGEDWRRADMLLVAPHAHHELQ
ncbi:MAG TPA: hypothetical protein VH328_07700 [Burkholderiaceae bacterium]|nr:hypothetical protein [Burkholderiaceae bacterium]